MYNIFSTLVNNKRPDAYALIHGNDRYSNMFGLVNFYSVRGNVGIVVEAEVSGLPNDASYSPRFVGMHIHENGDCSDNFENTGSHYNPTGADHPYHLGDLPPLLNSNGYAYGAFFDGFLRIDELIGKSIIIHNNRDDFSSQPSGDSGVKIGCGVIQRSI